MLKSYPGKRKAITLAIMLAGTSFNAIAQQDDGEIEEVLVTGSFIRGTPVDAPSPVQVVDRESMEAQGAAVIWDVIKNLEVNSGSITNPGADASSLDLQTDGTAMVNLRNLGENSTLTLINGKRQVPAAATTRSGGEFVDLNAIPLVMTERVEVLTDGGSALYGADAVAGVVNVIMRTDFEGLELYGDVQAIAEATDLWDATVSAIWGWASDDGNTHFVLSGERFERDPVSVEKGNFYGPNSEFLGVVSSAGSFITSSSFGAKVSPGWINQDVTALNIAEGGPSTPVFSDPGCYTVKTPDGSPLQIGRLREERGNHAGTCYMDNAEWNYISQKATRNSIAGSFDHTFANGAEFYSFAQFSDSKTIRADDGYTQSRGPTVFLAAPGAHTGNPAWGGYAIGQPLELGYYAPVIGLTRPTAADITNSPMDARNGGPGVAGWQQLRDGIIRVGSDDNETWTQTVGAQVGLRGELEIADRVLNYDVSYSWSGSSLEQSYRTFHRERAQLAANGLGGPNCTPNGVSDFDFIGQPGPLNGALPTAWKYYGTSLTQTFFPGYVFNTKESLSLALTSNNQGQGGCVFYNPFLTRLTDPSLANSQELMDWLVPTVNLHDKRNKLGVFDAVVSGELFEMAGGTAQFATGLQRRVRNTHSRASDLDFPGQPNAILGYDSSGTPNRFQYVSNNFDCAFCAGNYEHERTTDALFLELSLPFIPNVETQIALRYEDYGGNIGSEISPKIAMSWRPMETVLLRGSFSQSFRAPNIAIIEEGLESSNVIFNDPFANQKVRAGLLEPTIYNGEAEHTYTLGGPAPYVGNEYADTYSAGFLWTPSGNLDGLSVGADFWRFEVSDRVLPEPAISALQPEIDKFLSIRGDASKYILNSSISSSATNPFEPCNPNALEAQYGRDSAQRLECVVDPREYVVDGIQRAATATDANLITLTLAAVNAGVITADGVDVKVGYNFDTDLGQFRVGLDYTHVRQYQLSEVPGLVYGLLDTGVYDAAGTSGDGNLVRSLPDNKGHLTFSWMQGNHNVTAINRHIGSYKDLSYQTAYDSGTDFTRSLLRKNVDSYQTWDLQYNYSHYWENDKLGTTRFTVGVLDVFNEDLPYRESSSLGFDSSVFDGRGRRIYGRVLMQF